LLSNKFKYAKHLPLL